MKQGFAFIYLDSKFTLCGSCYLGQCQIPACTALLYGVTTDQILTCTLKFGTHQAAVRKTDKIFYKRENQLF